MLLVGEVVVLLWKGAEPSVRVLEGCPTSRGAEVSGLPPRPAAKVEAGAAVLPNEETESGEALATSAVTSRAPGVDSGCGAGVAGMVAEAPGEVAVTGEAPESAEDAVAAEAPGAGEDAFTG